jgi:hypothetical protein
MMESKTNLKNSLYFLVLISLVRLVVPVGVLPSFGDELLTLSLFIFTVMSFIYGIEVIVIQLIERPSKRD